MHVKEKNLQDVTQKTITLEDKMLVFSITEPNSNRPFSVMKLPLHTPTAWKALNTSSQFYTLGSLWCTIEYRHWKPSAAMKEANRIGVPLVNPIDRNPIVTYFTQANENSDQIDIQMRS